MNNTRVEPRKPQYSSSITIETDIPLYNGLLSPLLAQNLTPDQAEARNKIIALRTLVEFDFDSEYRLCWYPWDFGANLVARYTQFITASRFV